MKRLLVTLLILSLAVVPCVAASAEGEDGSLDYILEMGKLTLGLDVGFAPMGFFGDEGAIVGYDIDLAREVCARLGIELELQPIAWAAKEIELNAKNIDCIWNGLSITPARMESMEITPAYLFNALVFVVADPAYASKEDLAGKSVAVQSGSFAQEVLLGDDEEEADEAMLVFASTLRDIPAYEDYMMALMDLRNGSVDAVLIDIVVADYYLKEMNEDGACFYLEETLEDDAFGIAFRKGELALMNAVVDALLDMAEDGTLGDITARWFGEDVSLIKAP